MVFPISPLTTVYTDVKILAAPLFTVSEATKTLLFDCDSAVEQSFGEKHVLQLTSTLIVSPS